MVSRLGIARAAPLVLAGQADCDAPACVRDLACGRLGTGMHAHCGIPANESICRNGARQAVSACGGS
jgi:hypothetical protein